MYAFKINGGKKLTGNVAIKGAKNAILPLMCAALLTNEAVHLQNISYLSDVRTLIDLLKSLGCRITEEPETMTLKAETITSTTASYDFVSKMRASFWVLGPLLARCKEARVSLPGGCAIGARPVDISLEALEKMGAEITIENGYVVAKGPLKGADIVFRRISVGATINTLLAAVLTPGTTILRNAAIEPEVTDLALLLQKMGADIQGIGTRTLTITGVSALKGVTHTVIPDRIEAATFAVAAAITKGKIFMQGARADLMTALIDVLTPSQVHFTQTAEGLWVDAEKVSLKAVPVKTAEYPAFPTDDQPLITTLLCLAAGEALVTETIYENRFMHVPELRRMGAKIADVNNYSVYICGTKKFSGATVTASDLRGGVGLVLAGLAAEGETIVKRIYHIERGYFELDQKLRTLGADIERIQVPL